MAFFLPNKKTPVGFNAWYAFLGCLVLLAAFSLKIIDNLRSDHQVAELDIPAVSYTDIQDGKIETDEVDDAPANNDVGAVTSADDEETPASNPDSQVPDTGTDDSNAYPEEFLLAVPFTSQAPTGNWDALHEDACEEASFFMTVEFYNGRPAGKVDPAVVDPELTKLVDLETSMGFGFSIDTSQAAQTIQRYYGLETVVIDSPSVEDIKLLIASGKPVIVPAAGRELGNPNFTGEGPLYHMFVITGYTADTFITHDPGTRNGQNYVYDIDVVMQAMGDWNNGDPTTGAKRIFYIQPN